MIEEGAQTLIVFGHIPFSLSVVGRRCLAFRNSIGNPWIFLKNVTFAAAKNTQFWKQWFLVVILIMQGT